MYSFGYAVMGQLGHGDREERLLPKRIDALAMEYIVDAAGRVACRKQEALRRQPPRLGFGFAPLRRAALAALIDAACSSPLSSFERSDSLP